MPPKPEEDRGELPTAPDLQIGGHLKGRSSQIQVAKNRSVLVRGGFEGKDPEPAALD